MHGCAIGMRRKARVVGRRIYALKSTTAVALAPVVAGCRPSRRADVGEAKQEGKAYSCESCPFRAKAEANPKGLVSRLWRWHTTWCPGWKAYQQHLAETKS